MNKRANIPIILLVLGVLAVCSLALLSFYASNFKVSNQFSNVKLVEEMNSQIETNRYEGKSVEDLYLFDDALRSSLLKPLNKEIVFSVTYSP